MRRSGAITAARRLDVLPQMICAHILAHSAYSKSARDRQICASEALTQRAIGTGVISITDTSAYPDGAAFVVRGRYP
jgi:hypothetical protein